MGFVGTHNPPAADLELRRQVARREVEHILALLRSQPIGVQLGIVVDSMPGTSLQICKRGTQKSVAVSPYRLGNLANIRLGVATISAAPDATELYQRVTSELWSRALKGDQAADYIEQQLLGVAI